MVHMQHAPSTAGGHHVDKNKDHTEEVGTFRKLIGHILNFLKKDKSKKEKEEMIEEMIEEKAKNGIEFLENASPEVLLGHMKFSRELRNKHKKRMSKIRED